MCPAGRIIYYDAILSCNFIKTNINFSDRRSFVQIATPSIEGIEHAVSAFDEISHPDKLGNSLIIAGGGLVDCEIAYDERLKGKNVTVIEALNDIMKAGDPAPLPNGMMIKAQFKDKGVHVMISTSPANILQAVADGYAIANSI